MSAPIRRGVRFYRERGRQRVHVLHIGKTGGTALKHALAKHLRPGPYLLVLHRHAVTMSDVPVGEKVIFVLRDPISRFVSGFYSRQRQGLPRYHYPWTPEERTAFERFATPNEVARALSSRDDEERAAAIRAMHGIRHVRSSYWTWFGDEDTFASRIEDVFFVGFLERLDADFELLKRKLRLPARVRLPSDDIATHRNPPGLDTRLDDAARANLEAWYARDLAFVALCRDLAAKINSPTAGAVGRARTLR